MMLRIITLNIRRQTKNYILHNSTYKKSGKCKLIYNDRKKMESSDTRTGKKDNEK